MFQNNHKTLAPDTTASLLHCMDDKSLVIGGELFMEDFQNLNEEIWVPVTGFEKLYEVSSHGRIKSLPVNGFRSKAIGDIQYNYKGRIRSFKPRKKDGYCRVTLIKNGKRFYFYVHRIVAVEFVKNSDESKQKINHKDSDRANNHHSNLEWVTSQENTDHAYLKGRFPVGEKSYQSKLTNEDIFTIRASNLSDLQLSKKYSVHKNHIYKIKKIQVWRHLK